MECHLFSELSFGHCRVLDLEGDIRNKSTQLPNLWLRRGLVSGALSKVKLLVVGKAGNGS